MSDTSAAVATLAAFDQVQRKQRTWWQVMVKQPLALTGLIIITFFLVVAIIGPILAPYTPTEMAPSAARQAPSADHWFGTDEFGRDVFTRLLYGARISFQVGVISVGIAAIIGVTLGLIAGYFGGWLDNVISLLMDVLFAFPTILLAIALMTAMGDGIVNVMIAIGLVNAPAFMRVVRGSVLSIRNTAYIESALSVGATSGTIVRRHVFPNVTAPLIVHASLNFATAVLAEASLAYLSLGNKPPSPSWGSMVSTGYTILQIAPWAALFPGIAIGLTVLGFNLLGDGLRDALDPRIRNQG